MGAEDSEFGRYVFQVSLTAIESHVFLTAKQLPRQHFRVPGRSRSRRSKRGIARPTPGVSVKHGGFCLAN